MLSTQISNILVDISRNIIFRIFLTRQIQTFSKVAPFFVKMDDQNSDFSKMLVDQTLKHGIQIPFQVL